MKKLPNQGPSTSEVTKKIEEKSQEKPWLRPNGDILMVRPCGRERRKDIMKPALGLCSWGPEVWLWLYSQLLEDGYVRPEVTQDGNAIPGIAVVHKTAGLKAPYRGLCNGS